jgi:hypothetical protein
MKNSNIIYSFAKQETERTIREDIERKQQESKRLKTQKERLNKYLSLTTKYQPGTKEFALAARAFRLEQEKQKAGAFSDTSSYDKELSQIDAKLGLSSEQPDKERVISLALEKAKQEFPDVPEQDLEEKIEQAYKEITQE